MPERPNHAMGNAGETLQRTCNAPTGSRRKQDGIQASRSVGRLAKVRHRHAADTRGLAELRRVMLGARRARARGW